MDTVLTKKTKRRNATFHFGGFGESSKHRIGIASSRNFLYKNGAVHSVCVKPLLLDDGDQVFYSPTDATAFQRIKKYDEAVGGYSRYLCIMTDGGNVVGQKNADVSAYLNTCNGVGMGEMTTFTDRNFCAWLAVFGDKKCVLLDSGFSALELPIEKPNGTGCYFKHRLFVATKPSTLVYSAVDDFTNFSESLTEGGRIHFPNGGGEIAAIRAFKDELYLFFDCGIVKMKIGALPKEFSAETIEYRGGKILGRTVCVGERAIFFMAEDGLYRLDGRGVHTVGFAKIPYAETRAESAASWKGKALIRYQVGEGRYETLCVVEDGNACCYLDDMQGISQSCEGTVILKSNGYAVFQLCEEGNAYNDYAVLKTVETDMGTPKRKLLTKVKLRGEGICVFGIQNGDKVKRRFVEFVDGYAELRLHERGERFSFTIDANSFVRVSEVAVEMRVSS